jgi:hypothetical protein
VLSAAQTVWVALADRPRYEMIFPGARGAWFWATATMSALAGLNAIFIGLRQRWAVWLNPLIGVASIGLLQLVGGPRMNQLIVFVACALSTFLPWYLARESRPGRNVRC